MDQRRVHEFVWGTFDNDFVKVKLMLDATPKIINEKESWSGDTALIAAGCSGHTTIARLLLDRGAEINAHNRLGCTALMGACSINDARMVQLLLEKGADVHLKNERSQTALDLTTNESIRRLILQHIENDTLQQRCARTTTGLLLATFFNVIPSENVIIADRISTGFASVHRGRYRGANVAIKMLRGDGALQILPNSSQWQEIELLSNLRHQRILSLIGIVVGLEDRFGAFAGLVTEFMARGSLYSVLHLSTTPPEHRLTTLLSKLRVLKDVADGMQFLHFNNVIHRDLKSPNVLLDDEGRAKICDFGVCKLLNANATHTTAGGVGTPAWQAPESLVDDVCVVRLSSDVYSFGVIMWEMLTNSIPWNGVQPFRIAIRLSQGESLPLGPDTFPRGTPSSLKAILEECLRNNGDARPTFEHLFRRLSDFMSEVRHICPPQFICPISQFIMEDPVVCSDGHTYDRVYIERWLLYNNTSPVTNLVLESTQLRPNIALRGMIREFIEGRL